MTPNTEKNRWLALYVLCAGMLMIVLDATIVNVALPSIQEDLNFSQANLAWVVNAYLIPFGGLLFWPAGSATCSGSAASSSSASRSSRSPRRSAPPRSTGHADRRPLHPRDRRGARLGGDPGDDRADVPDRAEQAKAIGVYGFVASAGGSIGLLLGGVLTQAISWHFIFVINLPIGVLVGWLALRLVDNPEGLGLKEGADFPGAALVTLA